MVYIMCMSAKIETFNIPLAVKDSFRKNLSTRDEFMKIAFNYDRNRI